ncbi:immunoglobulin lambda-1 light chain-like [Pempheris klunzingeri]|uniref:immunoglobulin lambda-1 light chain-like n=1 Tax=Pempheris klunzingeri TaxID=3127111 RepID=UPI0039810A10
MLFLPAAALCCVSTALVAMAAELIQDDLTLTSRVGEKVSFSCEGTDQCDTSYVLWYQKTDTGTFTRILHIDKNNGGVDSGYNHPQKNDFSAVKKQKGWELQIQRVNVSHSASYYCSCGKDVPHRYVYLIFGSGTKLYVTGEQVVKPVVSLYPVTSRAQQEGKSSLLCVASGMFPPLVQFSWKRQMENCPPVELEDAEGEQLKLSESGCTGRIIEIDREALSTFKYHCSVKHEGGTVERIREGLTFLFYSSSVSGPATSPPPSPPPSPSPSPPTSPPSSPPASASFQSQCRVKLLLLLSTVLIVKSLVYCCGLCLLMICRNKRPSTNCTNAD